MSHVYCTEGLFSDQPQRPHLYPRTDPHMYSVFNISRGGEASTSDSHSDASSPTEISTMPPTSSVLVVSADKVSSRTLGSSQGGAGDPLTCRRKQGKSYAWLHRGTCCELRNEMKSRMNLKYRYSGKRNITYHISDRN